MTSILRLGRSRAGLSYATAALHRRLKLWLIVHVATASALLVLLAFHVLTALTLVP